MTESTHTKSAKERYPEPFEICECVISQVVAWMHRPDIPAPHSALGIVKFASAVRAFNLYKSINILLGSDHWEDAAVLARSMFELLLNLEEVVRREDGAEEKARKYLRFEGLQRYLRTRHLIDYQIKTGRCPGRLQGDVSELMKRWDGWATSHFAEFLSTDKRSEWQRSWCGKSVFKLAKESGNPLRRSQYQVIYSVLCDLSHGSPSSILITTGLAATPEQMQSWPGDFEKSEAEGLKLVLALSTIWFLEILFKAQSEIPLYDVKWNFQVRRRIYRLHGVEPPIVPWE